MTDWQFPTMRVLIFCKAPVEGQVKTRLIPALGAGGARDLHQTLAQQVFTMCQQAAVAPVQLWCAPDTTDEFFANSGLPLCQQQGADLGERMNHGLTTALAEGDFDAVDIMLPHDLHESVALACFNAGKHVLLEKMYQNWLN